MTLNEQIGGIPLVKGEVGGGVREVVGGGVRGKVREKYVQGFQCLGRGMSG